MAQMEIREGGGIEHEGSVSVGNVIIARCERPFRNASQTSHADSSLMIMIFRKTDSSSFDPSETGPPAFQNIQFKANYGFDERERDHKAIHPWSFSIFMSGSMNHMSTFSSCGACLLI